MRFWPVGFGTVRKTARHPGFKRTSVGGGFSRDVVTRVIFDFPSPPRFRCPARDVRWREMWSEVSADF